jgi:hypothetical protein
MCPKGVLVHVMCASQGGITPRTSHSGEGAEAVPMAAVAERRAPPPAAAAARAAGVGAAAFRALDGPHR